MIKENVRGENFSSKSQSSKVVKCKRHQRGQILRMASELVLVPKKNGKMRMCIDFTDLNKACKKDPVPLPRIDTSVDKGSRMQAFLSPELLLRIPPDLAQKRR